MKKSIFVLVLSGVHPPAVNCDPIPYTFPYKEGAGEKKVTDTICENFEQIIRSLEVDMQIVDGDGQHIPMKRVAEATIAYALSHNVRFWWIEENLESAYNKCFNRPSLMQVMESALDEEGWREIS